MSALDVLAPDQRAVIQLVLQQGRSYEELAALLGIGGDAVRARALAGLDRLAPGEQVSPAQRAAVADFLLGQQSVSGRERTRQLLAESPSARSWAEAVSTLLEPLASGGLPEIPAAAATGPAAPELDDDEVDDDEFAAFETSEPVAEPVAEPEPARRRGRGEGAVAANGAAATAGADADPPAARSGRGTSFLDDAFDDDDEDLFPDDTERGELPPAVPDDFAAADTTTRQKRRGDGAGASRSSRIGGWVLILAIALILAAVLIWVFSRDGDEDPAGGGGATPTATQGAGTTAAEPIGQVNLEGVGGSKAVGIAQLFQDGTGLFFQLAAQDLPANTGKSAYAVWLYNSSKSAVRLGFTPTVGENGELVVQNVLPPEAAQYKEIVLSSETNEKASRPAKIVLRGPLGSTLRRAGSGSGGTTPEPTATSGG